MLTIGYRVPAGGGREQHEAAHALLREMLHAAGLPTDPIERTPQGRPFLPGRPDVDFNLTHTAGLVVCALSLAPCAGQAARRVGLDAEPVVRGRDCARLAERFFAPCELDFFRAADAAQADRAFVTVFTRKESYAKCTGDGLAHHLRGTDTLSPDFAARHGVAFASAELLPGFCVTLCVAGGDPDDPARALRAARHI